MKITLIAPFPPPVTGQSLAIQTLYESLILSEDVVVIDITKKGFKQGVGSIGRIKDIFFILLTAWRVRAFAKIIYFNVSQSVAGNIKDLIIYAIYWSQLDKMVIHLHGGAGMKELLSKKNSLLFRVNAFFLRRLGAVIVLGDRLKCIYEDLVPAAKLYTIPNFARDEFFIEPCCIDKKFENCMPLRLLFLSNLLPGKGHVELLTALEQLPPDVCQRLHVDFAGGFESLADEASFREKVKAIKTMNINVHGIVHGDHKRMLLHRAHLLCLPTYYPYEGQPICILEAYAAGCAVLTTNHSGIFDVFTPGVNGIEVVPRSSDSIAQALQNALEKTEELCSCAKNNNIQAQLQYRSAIHVDSLRRIIFSLAR